MKTYTVKEADVQDKKWFVVDATDKVLGRLATQVAHILRGKHNPCFATHMDTGDYIVVINADKVRVTGKKEEQKTYFRHSGYPGGTSFKSLAEMRDKHPERVIELAVKGMLPHNKLGRSMFRKLNVYAGNEHPHAAQNPQPLALDKV